MRFCTVTYVHIALWESCPGNKNENLNLTTYDDLNKLTGSYNNFQKHNHLCKNGMILTFDSQWYVQCCFALLT